MKEKVVAIFDIGKTNKKILLFNSEFEVVYHFEEKFTTTVDEDGFECDDIELIEQWVKNTIHQIIQEDKYTILGVNFSTYGASLAYIDTDGNRLTPIYNYLKDVGLEIQQKLYQKYGGEAEFCRRTASPALGLMLNSGIQTLWLKNEKPDLWWKVHFVLHFPQYLSYLFTGKLISEPTSIGCHTFMWDFDEMKYHQWIDDENIPLAFPVNNDSVFKTTIDDKEIQVGTGIHDSSASLVPYLQNSEEKFILISTGTWCINMNPFNAQPLTAHQLQNDCLCFLTPKKEQVTSSRLFMGHFHEVLTQKITAYFNADENRFKTILYNANSVLELKNKFSDKAVYFPKGKNHFDEGLDFIDLSVFANFDEAYTYMVMELTQLCIESIELVIPTYDLTTTLYVSGGFVRNDIFINLLQKHFVNKKVITSEIENASALGAAFVIAEHFEGFDTTKIKLSNHKLTVVN